MITTFIILITIVTSIYAFNNRDGHNRMLMIPYRVNHNNEYYRFISSGFVHGNVAHLVFNMLSLFFFGFIVEMWLGSFWFIILYFTALVISDLSTYFKYKNYQGYASLGASGAISAVVFSGIIFEPTAPLTFIFLPFFDIPGFLYGVIYLIYSYLSSKNSHDNIGHEAHFYGAVYGVIFTIALTTIQGQHVLEAFIYDVTHWKFTFLQ